MSYTGMEITGIHGRKLDELCEFLNRMGLRYDGGAEFTVNLYDESDRIVGTGSLCGNVLKYIAVSDELQGGGAAATIASGLVRRAYLLGRKKLFLFTKPNNKYLIRRLGFSLIAETNSVIYMENSRNGLSNYLDSLEKGTGLQVAVVMNCNPFTLGHKYLLETAAKQVDYLHVFIVSEDKSEFSFHDRFELVKHGTEHISNLILHESGDYIISYSTFPTYFLKNTADANKINAELDLVVFGSRIAPPLGISKRFVGTEPYCAVTKAYNECMKRILPQYGIEVVEIERKDGISASKVRAAIKDGNAELIRSLVPETTYKYLVEKRTELK